MTEKGAHMERLRRFERATDFIESVNVFTMFAFPPATAVYGIWFDEWRPFQSSLVIGVTVLVIGAFIMSARDRARKESSAND